VCHDSAHAVSERLQRKVTWRAWRGRDDARCGAAGQEVGDGRRSVRIDDVQNARAVHQDSLPNLPTTPGDMSGNRTGSAGLRVVLTHQFCWPEVRRGGERYLHELAAGLQRAGHRVRILSTAGRPGSDPELGVPVRRLRPRPWLARRYGPLAGEVAFGLQAGARLGPTGFDVWHALGTADAAAASVAARLRSGRASVYTDLGVPARASRERRSDHRLHARAVRDLGSYVCLSTFAASYLRDGFGRPGEVVPGGVDTRSFSVTTGRDPRPTVLYAGTLDEPRKGVRDLLSATVGLRHAHPDLQVWLSGPGDARAVVDAVPGAADIVTSAALDERDTLAGRYRRAWVTVLPSTAEAFGLALVESLASGTPVVARSDGGGPTDIVRPGVGVLAAPEGLAAALGEAFELSAAPGIADACRARGEDFDWDRVVVPRLLEVYAGARRD
jgi:glycosyltransferase involved in cell wall biosynthesis